MASPLERKRILGGFLLKPEISHKEKLRYKQV
jgi:hypothetical protein